MPIPAFEKIFKNLTFPLFIFDGGSSDVLLTSNNENLNKTIADADTLFTLGTASKFEKID